MRYLLDSHIFVWFDDPEQLSPAVRAKLDDRENDLYLSVASIWELTLKRVVGKLHFTGSFAAAATAYQIDLVPVQAKHVEETERMPRFHKDPFDHMLLAQARTEGLVLVTRDVFLVRYGVPVWLV